MRNKGIFINLKRFDVPRNQGGLCPVDDPYQWAEYLIEESVKYGLGTLRNQGIEVTYLMPEALILTAVRKLKSYPENEVETLTVGCQGVYREDIEKGGNFGAFTTNLPAKAARNLGSSWSIIGHSEERADKKGILTSFEPVIEDNVELRKRANDTVDKLINQEVLRALGVDLNVLLCVGETAGQRGEGDFSKQKPRIEKVLKDQLILGLKDTVELLDKNKIVIGYEPIWAIGPGKTPPGREYISFVSEYIREVVKEEFGFEVSVVYGGGLKEANAKMIANIETIDGGLVGLTKFTGQIEFEPAGLKDIINRYLE